MLSLRRLGNCHALRRTMAEYTKPVEKSIFGKLSEEFQPVHLEILNESFMHNVPKGAETHFRVVVVSDKFDGVPLLKRHRSIQQALKVELETGVHALSIEARTPKQWTESGHAIQSSPTCMGGFGK